jgi:hypothetical protein
MDTNLINNPVLIELAKILANKTMMENLDKLSENIKKMPNNEKIKEMEDKAKKVESEKMRRKRYARTAYLKIKQKRILLGIYKRFHLLTKSEQVSCIVQLNNIFSED